MTRKRGERELFGIVIQPRRVNPEEAWVYAAVLKLRRRGLQVFRAGRDKHIVRTRPTARAKRMTTPQLVALAAE